MWIPEQKPVIVPGFPLDVTFRPECDTDLGRLSDAAPAREFAVGTASTRFPSEHPGVTTTVTSPEDLLDLLREISTVSDGHRMWQTMDLAQEYDGDHLPNPERTARMMALLTLDPRKDLGSLMTSFGDVSGPGF